MELLVNKFLNRSLGISEFLAPLHIGMSPDFSIARYQTGIDNMHADVVLSPKFQAALLELVGQMVHEELVRHGYSDTRKSPKKNTFDDFRATYRGLWESILNLADHHSVDSDNAKLLQITLLKILLESPGMVFRDIRKQLQKGTERPAGEYKGHQLELHDRLVTIAKHEPGIRYRTLRRLFKLVQQLESKELRKVRKSILGSSWVLPKILLFNPLLHLPDLSQEIYFLNHYPIIFMDRDNESFFEKTNRIVCELFRDYLADWCQPPVKISMGVDEVAGFPIYQREWRSRGTEFLDGYRMLEQTMQTEEFSSCYFSWLDSPKNADLIFPKPSSSSWISSFNSKDRHADDAISSNAWVNFQHRISTELHKRLYKSGILHTAIAAYRTPRLYRQLNEKISIRDIYQYLAGTLPRRRLIKHLRQVSSVEVDTASTALDTVFNYIQRIPVNKQLEYTARYFKDFLTFRRDLKLAHYTHQRMSYVRLLTSNEDISLSRDNGTLYEYRLRSETEPSEGKIRAHVVLKADIRGSTEITHQLMQKRLNPATHFSLNFFGPITELLENFNAQKVFVEGDALILSVLDMEGMNGQSMIVAYACGLARKIISVVQSQNRQNRYHELPKLELGIGIAFSDDAPAFLYDDKRKIMISPAINHADRLSSCASELRRNPGWKPGKHHHVEVMSTRSDRGQNRRLLRYNINGIILEPAGFERLQRELVMHKVRLQSRSKSLHIYYAGRFVDHRGTAHWLVVREAPVKVLTEAGVIHDPEVTADYFYEVITDIRLIDRVKAKLRYSHHGVQPQLVSR